VKTIVEVAPSAPSISAPAGEWAWEWRRCRACGGTGVRYSCGERSAEMTCRSCLGSGQQSVLVQKPSTPVNPS